MKTSTIKNALAAILLIVANQIHGQGTFVNLDFESPILPLTPDLFYQVPIANALPGWTGYVGDGQVDRVTYNTITLGAAAISFHGPGSWLTPYHGKYFVFLQGGYGPYHELVYSAIAQTGQIPALARSLRFYADNLSVHLVSFAGQDLPVFNLSGGIYGYQEYGADISRLAGQTGELRFTGGSGNLDYIRFSPSVIPEPSSFCLLAAGVLLFGTRFVRKRPWETLTDAPGK